MRISHIGREVSQCDVTSKKSVIFIFRISDLADIDENFSFLQPSTPMAPRKMWNQRSSFRNMRTQLYFDVILYHWVINSQYFRHNAVLLNVRN
jgi:hypothetical protein